jgi:O-antigen/teichoic acid export membrane protein
MFCEADAIAMTPYLLSLSRKLSPNVRKIFANAAWLFSDRILRMGFSVFIGAWVARYLGVENFGAYNYAIAFVNLFGAFANLGLEQIVIRDIVREPFSKNQILGTAFILRLMGGGIALIVSTVTIASIRTGDGSMPWLVAIISASLIFQAFDVIDFWFQSQVQSKYTVWAKNIAFVTMNLAKFFLIQAKAPLILFAWVYSIEFALSALGLALVYQARGSLLKAWRFTVPWAKRLLKDSWTLILTSFVIGIYMRIDQIMLGQMVGDQAVGIYSVAVRISELWYFVPIAITNSVYPSLVEAKQISERLYYQRIQKVLNLMSFMSYGVAIFFSIASGFIIHLLFGAEYEAASSILIVHVWTGVFVSSGLIRSLWTTTEGLMKFAFITNAIGALINVGLNLLLIKHYGGMGAATATVISQVFASYLTSAFFKKTRKIFMLQTKALIFPNPLSMFKTAA